MKNTTAGIAVICLVLLLEGCVTVQTDRARAWRAYNQGRSDELQEIAAAWARGDAAGRSAPAPGGKP